MKKVLCYAFACGLAWPAAALAFVAENRLPVNAVGTAEFEVVARGSTGTKDYWCAAGDYALSQGASAETRVYLVQGPAPSTSAPGSTAVRFSLDADAAGVTPVAPQLILSVSVVGDNLSVVSARGYCNRATRRS